MIKSIIRSVAATVFPDTWGKIAATRLERCQRNYWDKRIAKVMSCPDNAQLPRVPDAGKIVDNWQLMHNGLKVFVDGYYGDGVTRMLVENRGCHEPEEEVIFAAIVPTLPPSSTMLEVGAYWGFYSMWFGQLIKDAKLFLVEPDAANLEVGQKNFRLNQMKGDFTHAGVGNSPSVDKQGGRIISIESFLVEKNIDHLELLHADVQGFELEMLQGAKTLLDAHRIDYLFISTHSTSLHEQCLNFLEIRHYKVLASINMEESYSYDGLLVACSPSISPPLINLPPNEIKIKNK